MVDCLVRRANGAQGIKFVVESTKNPEYIENRISAFLTMMEEEILKMPEEKFESSKKALKAKKLPPTTLGGQFWEFFREIVIQQYHFNRMNVEALALKKVTKEELLSFYKVSFRRFCLMEMCFDIKLQTCFFCRHTLHQKANQDDRYRFMSWRNQKATSKKRFRTAFPKISPR